MHTMSYQHVKRCGQNTKSTDIHLVEIQEAEKCLNFLQGYGSFPVLDTLNFDWVHGDGILMDDDSKVFTLVTSNWHF